MALYDRGEEKTDVQDDPEAKALLREAFEGTSRWAEDFPGFTADLVLNDNGTIYKGSVSIKSRSELTVLMALPEDKKDLKEWLDDTVGMMASHRAWRTFEDADGKSPVTFGGTDAHPFGREVLIHGDGMSSRYRIKDGRIQQIYRNPGRMSFTINIEEAMKTEDNKSLTTRYVVFYFLADGKVMKVDSFTDEHAVLDGNYLPGTRRVISTNKGKAIVRILAFSNHRLLS